MLEIFKLWTVYLASGIEAGAGIIIGLAAIEATVRALLLFFVHRRPTDVLPTDNSAAQDAKENIRLHLSRWLALALEFELAADILRTAVAPTWSEIGQLAAIVALRTVLNYFLQREINQATMRHKGQDAKS